MYALNLGTDGRILSATFLEYASDDMPIVEQLPSGDIANYKYIDSKYIYDPLPPPEEPPMEDGFFVTMAELENIISDIMAKKKGD